MSLEIKDNVDRVVFNFKYFSSFFEIPAKPEYVKHLRFFTFALDCVTWVFKIREENQEANKRNNEKLKVREIR